ncbi:hypothetical protein PG985_014269 [Apiospora marii]|uniref:uncharacterized protein n=1 Tax=Apiospora marii TaxID=335849 RepID=UPI00312E1AE9
MAADASKASAPPNEQPDLHETQNNAGCIPNPGLHAPHERQDRGPLLVPGASDAVGNLNSNSTPPIHLENRAISPAHPQMPPLGPHTDWGGISWFPSSEHDFPHPRVTSEPLIPANGTSTDSTETLPSSMGDSVHHDYQGKPQPPGLMDNPHFRDFLDTIPESDPTTLQSLLPRDDGIEGGLPDRHLLPSVSDESRLITNEAWKPTNRPGNLGVFLAGNDLGPPEVVNGKRKLPSLQQMWTDNCLFQLYGENQGRRQKRHKKKGRQCTRCRLKNLKCSDGFPCTSCQTHWDKVANWTNEKKAMSWKHCFDARLEDLNVLVDLMHSTMFARTYPRNSSKHLNRYDGSFKHICFIKALVTKVAMGSDFLQSVDDQPSKRVPLDLPLSQLIHDIQTQLPDATWTLNPADHHSVPPSGRSSIRLSEIVVILFLHHDYLRDHTQMSSYDIYTSSLIFCHLFFEQILKYFTSGKIQSSTMNSSGAATDLAIDLGTLFFIVSYAPAHFQSQRIFGSTGAQVENKRSADMLQAPKDLQTNAPTCETTKYVFDELDRFLGPYHSESTQGRCLPFKAYALADRWAFLKDYLSHWVVKVRLGSRNHSTVASSLILTHRLCHLDLLGSHGRSHIAYAVKKQPVPPLDVESSTTSQDFPRLCKQMRDNWTPQKASEAAHRLLEDRNIVVWHLMALWWKKPGPDRPGRPFVQKELSDMPDIAPSYIRVTFGHSVERVESQLQRLDGSQLETHKREEIIQQEWQSIFDEIKSRGQRKQELVGRDNKFLHVMMNAYLKVIWT